MENEQPDEHRQIADCGCTHSPCPCEEPNCPYYGASCKLCPVHAAAPDLLAALVAARPDLLAYSNSYGGDYLRSLRLVDIAIAQAKGSEPTDEERSLVDAPGNGG